MWLIGSVGASEPILFKLMEGSQVIGRSPNCDIIITDGSLSRRHAQIVWSSINKRTTLVDLSSKNGTKVNGVKVQCCDLECEYTVQLAGVRLQLVDQEWLLKRLQGGEDETTSLQAIERAQLPAQEASEPLTAAQQQVLLLLLEGLDEKHIAIRLNRSSHTIHNHVRKIYRAFDVHARHELLARVLRRVG